MTNFIRTFRFISFRNVILIVDYSLTRSSVCNWTPLRSAPPFVFSNDKMYDLRMKSWSRSIRTKFALKTEIEWRVLRVRRCSVGHRLSFNGTIDRKWPFRAIEFNVRNRRKFAIVLRRWITSKINACVSTHYQIMKIKSEYWAAPRLTGLSTWSEIPLRMGHTSQPPSTRFKLLSQAQKRERG